jgi:hypothetical protein
MRLPLAESGGKSHARALPQISRCCYPAPMETGPKTDQGLPERLLKYLPALVISHIFVTVPTFVISLALAYATFVQADATRKMQVSGTWPYISFGTSNALPDGTKEISLVLANNGVGPARVEATQLIYKGKPMRNPREFLRECCAGNAQFDFMSSPVEGVLRPGEKSEFIRLTRTEANAAIWEKLNTERWKAVVRTCYCSIFDDCWVFDSSKKSPEQVDICPADWERFDEQPFTGEGSRSRLTG